MSQTPPQDYEALRKAVSERYDTLSKRLRQIASYAWDHPTEMAMETTAVIAERAGVQPSALIRFAKAFGYSGFSEMQRPFQAHVAERSASYGERIRNIGATGKVSDARAVSSLLDQYCEANTVALGQLRESVEVKDLEAAIRLLQNANHIYVMAQRRSYPIAAYLAYALNHADCRAHLLEGTGGMLYEHSRTIRKDDVLFAVSFSPYAEETASVIAIAKQNKASVIVITDSLLSPIANEATLCFAVQDAEVYSFRSLTASMCLAQTLVTSVAFRQAKPAGKQKQKSVERSRS